MEESFLISTPPSSVSYRYHHGDFLIFRFVRHLFRQ
jgi:hypothetical protein